MLFASTHPLGSRFCEQGTSVFQVAGSFRMTSGLLYFSSGSGGTSNSGADLRIKRDFLLLGGVLDASVAYSNRVGDVFFEGNVAQVFRRTGQVVGAFHYHLVSGSRVEIDDGHSFWGSTIEVGDANGGATLVVRSTDPAGAIQKGQSGGGNIQVRTQYWRSGSQVIYGGLLRQFISSDHPSVSGVHTRIDNPAGVEVSASGSTVICSGDLEILRGDLQVSRHYITVRGRLVTIGGRVLVDADAADIAVGLTVDGTFAPASGFPVVLAGSRNTNAGNAILYLNGNISGDGLLEFSGPNTQVVVGGSFRVLDRRLPVSRPFGLESLTIESTAGATVLEIDQPLEIGNWSSAAGFTGGLFLKGGTLRIKAPLVVSSVCALTGGILDFRGQNIDLLRNIQVAPPAGVFMSDASSILRVSSSFAGTDNSIAFAASANGLGVLELNRTADFTAVGNIRITPHLRLIGSLSVLKKLILTDGELLHDGGLIMASGAWLIRTAYAAFAAGSPSPSGGPYRLSYVDGKSPLTLRTGPESEGAITSLKMDVSDSVIISGAVAVRDSLWLLRGNLYNPSGRLLLWRNAEILRHSEAFFTGAVPAGDGYSLSYSGRSLVGGREADGALAQLTSRVVDTVRIISPCAWRT